MRTGTKPVQFCSTIMTERKREEDPRPQREKPPSGPDARPELLDPEKTPGTGMLPDPDDPNPSPTG